MIAVARSYNRATSRGRTFPVALTWPAPPIASIGKQSSSMPEYTRNPRPQRCSTRFTCSKSLFASFTPTTFRQSRARRAMVAGSMFAAVRPGML
jgi:hypothetical protein